STELLAGLLRQAPGDGYTTMEGSVLAENTPMLALARRLGFQVNPVPGDATVVRVWRALGPCTPSALGREAGHSMNF
ncbi:MAG: hypothetical protein ABIR35_09465, partial [Polaromonas sp.]